MIRTGLATLDVEELLDRLDRLAVADPAVWIRRVAADAVRAAAGSRPDGPLLGQTFAVKDNIDVAGFPTSAALPALERRDPATASAPVVELVQSAGALLVGKTNLDQLATGLVGLRSPYGAPTNPLDPALVPGGSSSGSAVAVASGAVDFALATDTAGSGRVPAACCGVVGLKPAPGVVTVEGIVPASPSFDCPSVMSRTVADALLVGEVLRSGFESAPPAGALVVGIPDRASLEGLPAAAVDALERDADALRGFGHSVRRVALGPFLATGELLYGSALLAERAAAIGPLLDAASDGVVDVVRRIVERGSAYSAVDHVGALARLEALRREVAPAWDGIDVLLVPSVPEVPTVAAARADPEGTNHRLGRHTTFANLLGLAAVTVPRGRRTDGTPASATVLAPAGREGALGRAALDLDPAGDMAR